MCPPTSGAPRRSQALSGARSQELPGAPKRSQAFPGAPQALPERPPGKSAPARPPERGLGNGTAEANVRTLSSPRKAWLPTSPTSRSPPSSRARNCCGRRACQTGKRSRARRHGAQRAAECAASGIRLASSRELELRAAGHSASSIARCLPLYEIIYVWVRNSGSVRAARGGNAMQALS